MRFSILSSSALLLILPYTSASTIPNCLAACLNSVKTACAQFDVECICRSSSAAVLSELSSCSNSCDIPLALTNLSPSCADALSPRPTGRLEVREGKGKPSVSVETLGFFTTRDGGLVAVEPITTLVTLPQSTSVSTTSRSTTSTKEHDNDSSTQAAPSTTSQAPASPSAFPTSGVILATNSPTVPSSSPAPTSTSSSGSSIGDGSNGSLFSMQGAGVRERVGGPLGLSIALMVAIMWI